MKIGSIEFIATIGCVSIIPLILTIPTFSAQTYGTGAMAHTIYTLFFDAICLFIIFHLFFQFPNKDIFDISEYVGGNFLKSITALLAISYLLTSATIVLVEFNENIKNILFPNASSEYIYLVFFVGLLVGVHQGLSGIFRAATIISPIIFISLLLMFFSLYKDIDVTNYYPILGNNIKIFFQDALKIEFFEGMILILLMGNKLKNPKKVAVWSYVVISILVLIITILLFGIIPYPSIMDNYFPFFELSRLISFGRFWQRVESIYTLIWLIAVYIYISIGPSFTLTILAKVVSLTVSNRIVPLICLLVMNATFLLQSNIDLLSLRQFLTRYITPCIVLLYPLVILMIAALKKRREKHETSL